MVASDPLEDIMNLAKRYINMMVPMTTNTNVHRKVTRRKFNLLDLAEEMGNVSRACRMIDYSRQQFYEIRNNCQTYGRSGRDI